MPGMEKSIFLMTNESERDHRGYVSQKKLDQVCGEHFKKTGHSQLDMLPVILEEFTPKNDDFLRLRREELWIRNYQSIEFGANKHF